MVLEKCKSAMSLMVGVRMENVRRVNNNFQDRSLRSGNVRLYGIRTVPDLQDDGNHKPR